ncbi:hypothetical protein Taro_046392 [Colocasia esculenta]|uniref:Uncharacterized protein n=1 Tax=Colocasia esculenta TaxID=4460 RepID=A0A843WYS9_COLES|nr:hypothetical protein [Colocasia esculenta]
MGLLETGSSVNTAWDCVDIVNPVFMNLLQGLMPSVDTKSRYGAWSTIGLQFWEEQPWEGFVGSISCWSFVYPSSYSSRYVRVSSHLLILEYQVRCQRTLLVSRRGEAVFMTALCGRCGSMGT